MVVKLTHLSQLIQEADEATAPGLENSKSSFVTWMVVFLRRVCFLRTNFTKNESASCRGKDREDKEVAWLSKHRNVRHPISWHATNPFWSSWIQLSEELLKSNGPQGGFGHRDSWMHKLFTRKWPQVITWFICICRNYICIHMQSCHIDIMTCI